VLCFKHPALPIPHRCHPGFIPGRGMRAGVGSFPKRGEVRRRECGWYRLSGSGPWHVLEKEPGTASVPCPGINPGRQRWGWGKDRGMLPAAVSFASSAHPSSDRFAATFSLKGRRGTGAKAAKKLHPHRHSHPHLVIVGLDPTIQKAAPRGAGVTFSLRACERFVVLGSSTRTTRGRGWDELLAGRSGSVQCANRNAGVRLMRCSSFRNGNHCTALGVCRRGE
jgi:hypothetical protein